VQDFAGNLPARSSALTEHGKIITENSVPSIGENDDSQIRFSTAKLSAVGSSTAPIEKRLGNRTVKGVEMGLETPRGEFVIQLAINKTR
jgi:hypothetical protein